MSLLNWRKKWQLSSSLAEYFNILAFNNRCRNISRRDFGETSKILKNITTANKVKIYLFFPWNYHFIIIVYSSCDSEYKVRGVFSHFQNQAEKTCAANEEQRYHNDNDDHIGGLREGRAVKTAAGRLWYTVHSLLLVYLLASTTLLWQLSISIYNYKPTFLLFSSPHDYFFLTSIQN